VRRERWIAAALLFSHRPDDKLAAFDLFGDRLKLLLPFLLSAFPCRLHETT